MMGGDETKRLTQRVPVILLTEGQRGNWAARRERAGHNDRGGRAALALSSWVVSGKGAREIAGRARAGALGQILTIIPIHRPKLPGKDFVSASGSPPKRKPLLLISVPPSLHFCANHTCGKVT